jgi:hypothetical protein
MALLKKMPFFCRVGQVGRIVCRVASSGRNERGSTAGHLLPSFRFREFAHKMRTYSHFFGRNGNFSL